MSADAAAGLALLRQLAAAARTSEGRDLLRTLHAELSRAAAVDVDPDLDPIERLAHEAYARGVEADRRRASGASPPQRRRRRAQLGP